MTLERIAAVAIFGFVAAAIGAAIMAMVTPAMAAESCPEPLAAIAADSHDRPELERIFVDTIYQPGLGTDDAAVKGFLLAAGGLAKTKTLEGLAAIVLEHDNPALMQIVMTCFPFLFERDGITTAPHQATSAQAAELLTAQYDNYIFLRSCYDTYTAQMRSATPPSLPPAVTVIDVLHAKEAIFAIESRLKPQLPAGVTTESLWAQAGAEEARSIDVLHIPATPENHARRVWCKSASNDLEQAAQKP